jgi:hypothetical protein
MKQLRVLRKEKIVKDMGDWSTAKNYFPKITVNQETGSVYVTTFRSGGYQTKGSVSTLWIETQTKGNAAFIRGEVLYQNYKHCECSGRKAFCFAVFESDSGHIYLHHAPATKRWMNAKPTEIRKFEGDSGHIYLHHAPAPTEIRKRLCKQGGKIMEKLEEATYTYPDGEIIFVRETTHKCSHQRSHKGVKTTPIPGTYGYKYGCVDECNICGQFVRERYYD